jgi:hypothetical protein
MIGVVSRTRAALTAAVVLSALALGGCSDDEPEPKFTPPSTTAPAEASPDGASFVRSYFELIGRATKTGETSTFLASTSEGCDNCMLLAKNIERGFAAGSYVEGADWSVDDVSAVGETSGGTVWNVNVATARERWYDANGNLIRTVRPSNQHFAVIVETSQGAPVIVDMRLRS